MIQKYTEQFKRPELFASINGQIVSVPVEPENPLRTAEMTLEDDYGMIDGIINNGRRGEELQKAQTEARRTTPEKSLPSGSDWRTQTGVRGTEKPGQACPAEEAPGAGRLMSRSKKWRLEWAFFLGENGRRQYNKLCKGCVHPCKQSFRAVVLSCPHYLSLCSKKCGN